MPFSAPHSAIKFVDLDGRKNISTDATVLQRYLLAPEVRDKPVCVVSITGIFRQGKSFVLNFLLRYLNLKYKQKKPIGDRWLQEDGSHLSGFEWKCGKERHTIGILMWPEIFIAELSSGQEIAIILLDTQGTFDNQTTKQHCAAVFAISTLISSVQIYNIMKQINQADLEHMECFSGYGQLASGSNATPFQDVCFLIRDWQNPGDNPYGAVGGEEYLREHFRRRSDQPEEILRQNANIQKLFQNQKCFLLPYPGNKVATDRNFNGKLEEIDEEFRYRVQELAPYLLAPEKLVQKKINGELIRVGDLAQFIDSYCKFFMSDEVPKLESMYKATATAHYNIYLSEVVMRYKEVMDSAVNEKSPAIEEPKLKKIHEETKTQLVQYINSKNIIGKEDMKEEYDLKLKKTLDDIFSEYQKLNKMKLEMDKELKKFEQELKKKQEDLIKFDELIKQQGQQIKDAEVKRQALTNEINAVQSKIKNVENTRQDWFSNFKIPWLKIGLGVAGTLGSLFGLSMLNRKKEPPHEYQEVCYEPCPPLCPPCPPCPSNLVYYC